MEAAVLGMPLPPALVAASNRKSRDSFFHVLLLVIALAVGTTLANTGPSWLRRAFELASLDGIEGLSTLVLAAVLALLVHESGHLLVALGLAFEVLGMSLGPVRLQCLHGKWKASWSGRRLLTASVSAVPMHLENWRVHMLLVVAAGQVATLLACLLGFWVVVHASMRNDWPLRLWAGFAQINFYLFLLGLIPNGTRARVRNDATLFLSLLKNDTAAAEINLYLQLVQLVLTGVRPEDYPVRLMMQLAEWQGRDDSNLTFAQAMVRWAIDRGDIKLADAWDTRAVALSEHSDKALKNITLAWSACFDVLFREDMRSAANKFSQVDFATLFPICLEHQARAARRIALGHAHLAPAEIIRAQYALPRGIPSYDFERELLAKLHMLALTGRWQTACARAASAGA